MTIMPHMPPTARFRRLSILDGHGEWRWLVALGAVSALLGIVASLNLVMATLAAIAYLGALMLLAGGMQIVLAIGMRRRGWGLAWLASGMLYAAAAIAMLFHPFFAAALLTILLSAYLAASGLMRCWIGVGRRGGRGRGRGWLLLSGLASIAAALLIGAGWPESAAWMPGLALCIDLMVQGAVLMAFGLSLKRAQGQ